MTKMDELYAWIKESQTLVFFTGAGISVPSGIPDFRSDENRRGEEILNYGYMRKNPDVFSRYVLEELYPKNVKPNIAHELIARLSQNGTVNSVVTQNIDDLHQYAGTKRVYPLHGSIHEFYCMECEKKYEYMELNHHKANYCSCGGFIRPAITLYGEPLDETYLHLAQVACQIADMIIVVGSSLQVDPAASLLRYYAGHRLVIINASETPYDRYADLIITEDISDVFQELERKMNQEKSL